jgi:hypothetical protein
MCEHLVNKSREQLILKILELIRFNNSLKSELLRYKLLTNSNEKFINFLLQIRDENKFNFNESKENEFKEQINSLKSIKLFEIKLNRLQINQNNYCLDFNNNNKEVFYENESDFDLNTINFDKNTIISSNCEQEFDSIDDNLSQNNDSIINNESEELNAINLSSSHLKSDNNNNENEMQLINGMSYEIQL